MSICFEDKSRWEKQEGKRQKKPDQRKNVEPRRDTIQENETIAIASESMRRIQFSAQRNLKNLVSKNFQVDQAEIYQIWRKNIISLMDADANNILKRDYLLFRIIIYILLFLYFRYAMSRKARRSERKTRGSPFRCTLRKYSNPNGPLRMLFSRRRRHCVMVRRTGFYGLMFWNEYLLKKLWKHRSWNIVGQTLFDSFLLCYFRHTLSKKNDVPRQTY